MEERIIGAAIAGLLHDIGKLEQRARQEPWKAPEGIDPEGQPVHAAWSQYFCAHHIPPLFRAAALAGAYHHHPEQSPAADKSLSKLIALADKLSAGERADLPDRQKGVPRQMATIFDRVSLADGGLPQELHYLPLKPLALRQEVIFPGAARSEKDQMEAYSALTETLRVEVRREISDPQVYLENLQALLQQYTWAVPSAYYHSVPDVSLYDHSRMTAALAVCLAGRPEEEIERLLAAVRRGFMETPQGKSEALLAQPAALLVGGDISGVQDFIYTISSKQAAQTLRGRSFYLQLLNEAALRFVLERLGLPVTNVIYSGGGHFFLLAPLECKAKLDAVREELTRILIRHHGTSLYLALDFAEVPFNGFRIGSFPTYWGEMHAALGRRKQRRYTELKADLYDLVFAPPAEGGNPDATCSVCGEDHRTVIGFDEREEQERICSLCQSFAEEIGRKLPTAKFVALGWSKPEQNGAGKASDCLRDLGMSFEFVNDVAETIEARGAERFTLWALDDPAEERWPRAAKPCARVARYTVHQVPGLTFDELQNKTRGGFSRLGVLRMDVDNLGSIFKEGFGRPGTQGNRATLARLTSLSFQLSLFFEGWIKRLCEEGELAGLIYTVYAGGDDVFLVGPWDRMPDLAMRIREQFAAYTAGHPDLHLSAGQAFIGGKYPVYQAAQDAGEALQAAKNAPGKNAFSFIGSTWSWPEFIKIAERKERLARLVGDGTEGLDGPNAILSTLRELAEQQAETAHADRRRALWGPWIWRGMYRLTRMADRYQSSRPELATELGKIRDALHANHYQDIREWGAAARWTQLLTRKSQEDRR